MKERILKIVYTLLIIFLVGNVVYAKDVNSEDKKVYKTETITYINPLYKDVLDKDEIKKVAPVLNASSSTEFKSVNAAAVDFRNSMKKRVETITVYVTSKEGFSTTAHNVFDTAIAHTKVATEGDYLRWQYGGWSCGGSYTTTADGTNNYSITYTMTYYTTKDQEDKVTSEINKTLKLLALSGSSYDKVSKIYDYITRNVRYDYTNLNDDAYKLKYTAYAALVNKTSVCQGYALLFYRMALESGIDSRLIAGDSTGGRHAWNIVKVGKYYYNIDSTWDAGRSSYSYYLLNNSNFTDHYRDYEYNTTEFNNKYVMSTYNYTEQPDKSEPTTSKTGLYYNSTNKRWEYYKNGKPDYTYNGFATNSNGTYYIDKGLITFKRNGLMLYNKKWVAVINSKVNNSYTGVLSNSNGTYLVENGTISFKYNGTYKDKTGNVYIINNSKVNTTVNGLKCVNKTWYYFKNGKTDLKYNGFAKNSNGIYYVEKGIISFKKNELMYYNNNWVAVINSKVNTKYNGLSSNKNGTYLVENGKVNFGYNGKLLILNGNVYKHYNIKSGKVV